ncbi:Hypothetical predicted protein, partial [Paramuricea clavata]
MSYRDTPLENGYSPAELLFGRKIQTTLPVVSQHLVPTWSYLVAVREKEERIKKRQKKNYDFRNKVKTLQQIEPDCPVWIPDRKESGTIINKFETPRSYVVKTPTTTVQRNRRHLIEDPSKNSREELQEATSTTSGAAVPENNPGYYTRSGRLSAPPDRLLYIVNVSIILLNSSTNTTLPGTTEQFVLNKYREDVGRNYNRITIFIATKTDCINYHLFEIGESLEAESSDNNHDSEDDDDRIIDETVNNAHSSQHDRRLRQAKWKQTTLEEVSGPSTCSTFPITCGDEQRPSTSNTLPSTHD